MFRPDEAARALRLHPRLHRLGEDGPTHQPIEQLTSLRSTPNPDTWRPADAVESAVAWKAAIERKDGPERAPDLLPPEPPHQARDAAQTGRHRPGGYVLKDSDGEPELILIATGSEVAWQCRPMTLTADPPPAGKVRVCPCRPPACSTSRTPPTSRPCCRSQVGAVHRHRSRPCRLQVQVRGSGMSRDRHDQLQVSPPRAGAVRAFRLHRRQHRRHTAEELWTSDLHGPGPSWPGSGVLIPFGPASAMSSHRPFKVALNVYGRIGRCVPARVVRAWRRDGFEIVAPMTWPTRPASST